MSTGEAGQPIPQGEPAQAQPFLLGAQVDLLGVQLVFELSLEVVEQVVPAHTPKLA
ncbi:hypothetical protein [Cryobacterium fucosi]|uniref:hypothetical protein n=1 Tax=Cryobacterium fucosi TaxID=1259157 RepID=UPI00141BCBB7|nr:hypothetical protein [Cryobacterium fucosi]